ncbi:MAG: HEAT repeat domain-containing protein [Anaerolineae bacterium]|nr:HEAT repeat domain-containing protein [Anaerolineae bacterium]
MPTSTPITGREPRISSRYGVKRGWQRLSPRRLGTLLNVLSPQAVSLDAAAAMLHNDDFYVRYNAARLLGERGDRDARLIMQAALETGNGPTRASVARQMHRFSWYAAAPAIRQALNDGDERVREGAVYALCDLRELAAYQLLTDLMPDETDTLRAAAAWGLRNCQDSAAVPVLAAVLQSRDPDVRIKALESLSGSRTEEAIPIVTNALHADSDREVIYYATLALLELRGVDCLFDLAEWLQTTSGARLEPMLRGLFHATNYLNARPDEHPAAESLLAALDHALHDATAETRRAAVWLLAWMRLDRAGEILAQAFRQETDRGVQLHILRVATSLMSESAPQLLELATQSADEMVAAVAIRLAAAQEDGTFATYDEDDAPARPLGESELIAH